MVMPKLLATAALSLTLLSSAALGADYFAVVDSFGRLSRGVGVDTVTQYTKPPGSYVVRFNARIKTCVFVATIATVSGSGVNIPGLITTENAGPYAVFVRTFDVAGVSSDRSFHLFVGCPNKV